MAIYIFKGLFFRILECTGATGVKNKILKVSGLRIPPGHSKKYWKITHVAELRRKMPQKQGSKTPPPKHAGVKKRMAKNHTRRGSKRRGQKWLAYKTPTRT